MNAITRNTKSFTTAAVAAVCLASVAINVHADEAARTVRYSDLNLNTRAGAAVLYKRIRVAAEDVCGDVHSWQPVVAKATKVCVDRAIFTGVRSVDAPMLTSEYDAHAGVVRPMNVASLH